jgi:pimeloyl-ACP methyl ester carboxylesterase
MSSASEHLQIAGVRLEYRRLGPSPDEAPTIIMLHEGLGSVSTWRDFPDRVAEVTGLGVFVYSRTGYGGSSPCELPRPLTYMHDEALETLPRVLDAIGIDQGILLGHSDGASIAAIYAGALDDPRVRGLVLLAPHFFTEDCGIQAIAEARERFENSDFRERLARHHGENTDVAFRGWNGAWLDPEFRNWDIQEYLAKIEIPVLIIQGEDDEYGTEKQIDAARTHCNGNLQTRLLPNCGHSPQRDQPEHTLSEIKAFSDRIMSLAKVNR